MPILFLFHTRYRGNFSGKRQSFSPSRKLAIIHHQILETCKFLFKRTLLFYCHKFLPLPTPKNDLFYEGKTTSFPFLPQYFLVSTFTPEVRVPGQ